MALYAFDGTGNKDNPGIEKDTNVVKFCKAYVGKVFYQAGVGSGGGCNNFFTKWLDKISGGLTGRGGKEKVKRAMVELAKNIANGDVIVDIIGFSRGAALAIDLSNEINDKYQGSIKIRFLGLFDIVASFGMPGNKINLGYNLSLPNCVINCYHAISLDERRAMFPLTRIIQDKKSNIAASKIIPCLFRGFHSDVGGGNGNHGLSNVSLAWLISMALHEGLGMLKERLNCYSINSRPMAACTKPHDLIPNKKRTILEGDFVHESVMKIRYACKGFEANNPPAGLRIASNDFSSEKNLDTFR